MADEKIVVVCKDTNGLMSQCHYEECDLNVVGKCGVRYPAEKPLNKGDVVTIEIKRAENK